MSIMKLYGKKKGPWQDLLAFVLQTEYGIAPLPALDRKAEGKPFFPGFPHLHFSISHSKEWLLCAVSTRPVGVDIEDIQPRRSSLPKYALSPAEYAEYQRLGESWQGFYRLWTKKEAWCKYTGLGLRALWGQTPPGDLSYGYYSGKGWQAAVCGEEPPPKEILWLEGDEDEADKGIL